MSSFVFPIANAGQQPNSLWQRIDKGQDFQTKPGTPLVAVVSGTLDAGHDPNGFGPRYPILHGDDGKSYYYGHVDLPTILQGKHVKAGTIITRTLQTPRGNATSPGWLEFGDASLLGVGGETGGGPIHNLLKGAQSKGGGGGISIPGALEGAALGLSPLGAPLALGKGLAGQAAGAASGAAGDLLNLPGKAEEATANAIVSVLANSLGIHASRILLYIVLVGGAGALIVAGLARAGGLTSGDVAKAAVAVPK